VCSTEVPPLREVSPGHWSACHFAEEVPAAVEQELVQVRASAAATPVA
jgi:hypothetical protein